MPLGGARFNLPREVVLHRCKPSGCGDVWFCSRGRRGTGRCCVRTFPVLRGNKPTVSGKPVDGYKVDAADNRNVNGTSLEPVSVRSPIVLFVPPLLASSSSTSLPCYRIRGLYSRPILHAEERLGPGRRVSVPDEWCNLGRLPSRPLRAHAWPVNDASGFRRAPAEGDQECPPPDRPCHGPGSRARHGRGGGPPARPDRLRAERL